MQQHKEPAWRHKADFIFGAKITDREYARAHAYEQLWGRKLADGQYEVCAIPFSVYDLFLGDVVTLDNDLRLEKIVRRSGHYGFRVATANEKDQDAIRDKIQELGSLTERYSSKLMAVDAENLATAQKVADLLQEAEDEGSVLGYETIKK